MRNRQSEIEEKKKSCKILIVDDDVENVDYILYDSINYLRKTLMMDVRTLPDLGSLEEARPFDIVICDVDGVGKKMNLPDGIDLTKRLRSIYKDKIYAIMSQQRFQLRQLNIEKDISRWDKGEMAEAYRRGTGGTLEEKVLRLVDIYADPATRWETIRMGMLKNAMSIHDVARLESAYVKSILKKDVSCYDNAVRKLDSPIYDSDEKILNYIRTAASIISAIISII